MDWFLAVEAEPAGILVSDGAGLLTYVNPAAVRVLGAERDGDLIGRPVSDLLLHFPVAARRPRILASGESVWYLAAEALAGREEALFAAEVGDALAGNLNMRRTVGRIVDLTVPRLAPWAAVTLWDNDRVRQVSRAAGGRLDEQALPARRLDEAGRRRSRRAAETEFDEAKASTPQDLVDLGMAGELAAEVLRDGPVRVVTMALRAHGTMLGVLCLTPRAGLERATLLGLARRAAVAVNAARVYEERSTLAATLRSALMPAPLPDPPGLQVGAAYRPAMETTEIGGDFYEMVDEGPAWSFTIGDVCGKGVEAAILTGQVRQSLGTVSLVADRPAERLELLNSALLRADGTSFVTMVHGLMRLQDGQAAVSLSSGGHPYPLLRRRDGRVEEVAVSGPIVGMLTDVVFKAAELTLGPGEMLLCFTDGLPDARGADGMYGVERIVRVLADSGGMTAQATADRLLQSTLEHLDGRPHDDMAVLAIQMEPTRAGP